MKEMFMASPQQIAHRAREVSRAKTNLLRVVVSERVSSMSSTTPSSASRAEETRNTGR